MQPDPETRPQDRYALDAGAAFSGGCGEYCRPGCERRARLDDACKFYKSSAAAEADGLAPCPVCKPESMPVPQPDDAPGRLAHRAAMHLQTLDGEADTAALAALLDVDEATLSQAFGASFGVTPAQYAETHRLHVARRLVAATALPAGLIAQATGFADERALLARLGQHGRKASRAADRGMRIADHIEFDLGYQPPYAWSGLLGFLGGRAIDGVESIEDGRYRRTLRATHCGQEGIGWVEVAQSPAPHALRVHVATSLAPLLPQVLARVRQVFDLGLDPLAPGAALGELAADEPGLRLPGAFDPFELAVRAVLGQQITVKAARTLAARFTAAFGTPITTPFSGLDRLFPTPATIAAQSVDAIASLGIIGARARTILGIADAIAAGRLLLRAGADFTPTVQALKSLPGIGDWTAQYIAMRALGARDAFPHTDYGVMKSLDERNPRRVLALAEPWRPWRAYAVMHLWRRLA